MPSTYRELLDVWLEADTIPEIEHAWLWDHMMPLREPASAPLLEGWTLLSALAARTRRLRMGLMVTGNPNRHPALLAKIAATVDVISDGRLELGIGAGGGRHPTAVREYEAYGVPTRSQAEAVARLDEACGIIRRMWTEPVVDHDGPHYRLRGTVCEPKPVQRPHPPFVLGGSGDRLLRVAARHADRWNLPIMSGPLADEVARFRERSAALDRHCAAIGRDPAEVERSVQLILDDLDPAEALGRVRVLLDAGATHFVLGVRRAYGPGWTRWIADEIVRPLLAEGVGPPELDGRARAGVS